MYIRERNYKCLKRDALVVLRLKDEVRKVEIKRCETSANITEGESACTEVI